MVSVIAMTGGGAGGGSAGKGGGGKGLSGGLIGSGCMTFGLMGSGLGFSGSGSGGGGGGGCINSTVIGGFCCSGGDKENPGKNPAVAACKANDATIAQKSRLSFC